MGRNPDEPNLSDTKLQSNLRTMHGLGTSWVIKNLPPARKILDVGCGAGILANAVAKASHRVTGIDTSEESLNAARNQDETRSVRFLHANAYSLPFRDGEFDAVCVMNVLESVEEPHLVIGEAARVLKAKGILFFHAINRTMTSYLFRRSNIQFIKPDELEDLFEIHKLRVQQMTGIRPCRNWAFWKMLVDKQAPNDLAFSFCSSLSAGYCGIARKRGNY